MILMNTDIKNFNDFAKDKEIICFGSGKYLDNFFKHCPLINQIKFIVDNNQSKWNTIRKISDQQKKILSPENLPLNLNKDSIILITAGVIGVEIYHQLENMQLPKDQKIFWSAFILNELESWKFLFSKPLPNDLKISTEPLIPKIIHYCWVGKNPIPKEYQNYIEGWRKLCPDYEIICWNEKNYDIEKHSYMKQAYEAEKWSFVTDYMRKDIIYQYGGIYLDTDVEMIKRPDELLYQDGFCGIEFAADNSSFKVNVGLGFGARKKFPLIKKMCEVYDGEDFNFRERKFMKIGPDYETEIIEESGIKITGDYQIISNMTVYPVEVLSGITYFSRESFVTEKTFTLHHYANSWKDKIRREREIEARRLYKLCNKVGDL